MPKVTTEELVISRRGMALRIAATRYDRRRQNRPGYNHYALAMYLGAVEDAMKLIEQGKTPRQALCECFNDRLLDCLLKSIGEPIAVMGVDK